MQFYLMNNLSELSYTHLANTERQASASVGLVSRSNVHVTTAYRQAIAGLNVKSSESFATSASRESANVQDHPNRQLYHFTGVHKIYLQPRLRCKTKCALNLIYQRSSSTAIYLLKLLLSITVITFLDINEYVQKYIIFKVCTCVSE